MQYVRLFPLRSSYFGLSRVRVYVQLETYDEQEDGRRVRLTQEERDRLLSVYDDGNHEQKWIGMALLALCGCRSQEAVDVRPMDLVRGESSDRWYLRIPSGKGHKERLTPMPPQLAGRIRVVGKDIGDDRELVDRTARTLRRWVIDAVEERAEAEDDQRWDNVRPHDLRRTWGQLMLEDGVMPSVLMQWGGWSDWQTFKEHYLGHHSERVQDEEAEKVGWL